jgi:hypothetical protein
MLQILSVSIFERIELKQMLAFCDYESKTLEKPKQLKLF